MIINMNDKVRLKLTEHGYMAMAMCEYLKYDKVDADGWLELHLWEAMLVFGPFMFNGNPNLPFETDIELKRNPWSDIGTAPKDGRWILLGGGSYSDEAEGKSDVMVARWEPKQGNINEGWLVCAAECGYSCFYYENPTKWMEVPR
jgi:hypothetical protein